MRHLAQLVFGLISLLPLGRPASALTYTHPVGRRNRSLMREREQYCSTMVRCRGERSRQAKPCGVPFCCPDTKCVPAVATLSHPFSVPQKVYRRCLVFLVCRMGAADPWARDGRELPASKKPDDHVAAERSRFKNPLTPATPPRSSGECPLRCAPLKRKPTRTGSEPGRCRAPASRGRIARSARCRNASPTPNPSPADR